MPLPTVSVVMGVKNAEDGIAKTIHSVLSQDGVDLEFIIINDGSTDSTEQLVQHIATHDNRIKLISQENRGLTASLIEGCRLAKGEYIARQDANDISLPGRFKTQTNILEKNKEVSFCSTFVRHITKEGISGLVTKCEGIIHGSVMMRRNRYMESGGYRPQFYYAQDIDLWSRLLENGSHISIPEIYYEGLLFPDSITGSKSTEQRKFLNIIRKASKARKKDGNDHYWLKKAESLSLQCRKTKGKISRYADGAYFIGACLLEHNPSVAKRYFEEAIGYNQRHLRARLKLGLKWNRYK